MTTEREALLGDPPAPTPGPTGPPPRRDSGLRKAAPIIVAGTILAVMLLIIVFNLDDTRDTPLSEERDPFEGTALLDVPTPIEISGENATGMTPEPLATALPQGGWIQTTNEDGRLAQQYRAASLDPNPPGTQRGSIAMRGLDAQLFLDDGRIVTMQGDHALVYAPDTALSDGEISGNVIIRIYEPEDDTTMIDGLEPTLEVRTPDAAFDNFSGEITCSGSVDVQSATARFIGHGLLVTINDTRGRIEYLRVDDVESIEFLVEDTATAVARCDHAPRSAPNAVLARSRHASVVDDESAQFYAMTMTDDVRIEQGEAPAWRTAKGESLRAVFTFEHDPAADDEANAVATRYDLAHPSLETALTASVFGAMSDGPPRQTSGDLFRPSSPDDVVTVRCDGPLIMVPTNDPDDLTGLTTAGHRRLHLTGPQVTLTDEREGLTATCGAVIVESPNDRLTLRAAEGRQVLVTSPSIDGAGDRFTYDRSARRAVFDGAGWLIPRESTGSEAAAETIGDGRRVRIAWTERAECTLVDTDDDEPAMERATIVGAVDIESDDGRIRCDALDVEFVRNADRGTSPGMMLARGRVRAEDDTLSLRAAELEVHMMSDGEASATTSEATSSNVFGGTMRVRDITARGDVRLLLADGSRSFSDELHTNMEQDTLRLSGEQVIVVSDRMILRSTHRLDVRRRDGLVTSDWPGQAHLYENSLALSADPPERIAMVDQLIHADADADLRIRWTDGMRIAFSELEDGDAVLRGVYFRGSVRIDASEGHLRGDSLDLAFTPRMDGTTAPSRLHLVGNVEARDRDLAIWTDDLTVTLRDPPDDAIDDDAVEEPILVGNASIDTFRAAGGVQVLLEGGARVFADDMHGSAPDQRVVLTGDDVIIVADRLLLERCTQYELRKGDGILRGTGRGEARVFTAALIEPTAVPVDPPTSDALDEEPDVFASWSESMRFDSRFNDDAGALDLRGNVVAISRPSPLQLDELTGGALRLEFVFDDRSPTTGVEQSEALVDVDRGNRALGVLFADVGAQLESRVWENDDLSDTPRVFHVRGPSIRYDNQTGDALVDGAGEMLMRDVRPVPSSEPDEGPFASRGVSRFRWSDSMQMIHAFGERYDATIEGDVEVVHQSLTDQITTITGQALGVTMLRTPAEPIDNPGGDAMSFGGNADIRRIWGRGALFIRTPNREAECDRFDYNRYTELARLESDPGRSVIVRDRESVRPVRAQIVLWNLRTDSITIERAGG